MNMRVEIINLNGSAGDYIELPADIYGIFPRVDVMNDVVKWQRLGRMSGTHKAKVISEISGTTKKPFAQKGRGGARHGSLRSPQFRGGAVIFGPVVRSHAVKLNKKVRKLGLKSALSLKASMGKLFVINDLNMASPSTKEVKAYLEAKNFASCLFVSGCQEDDNFKLSVANLFHANYLHVDGLNVYDILHHEYLIINKSVLDVINGKLDG